MVLSFAFCNVPVMPVRSEPSHRAEQVNQLLLGERAEILEVNDSDWARIRGEWDNYEGWCKIGQLFTLTRKEYKKGPKFINSLHNSKLIFDNSEMWLPLGCDLTGLKKGKITIGNSAGKFKGKKIAVDKLVLNYTTLSEAAHMYMNAPYQWGGRTVAGIDCSGLTQMAFKLCGKPIPRDASQQALEGETVDFLQHSQCGDLAFFENKEGKIVHVGILLNNHTIIHAADTNGRVATDRIDQGGIISTMLKKRTHHLRFVKRYLEE